MFAVVRTGGKQYKVASGDVLSIEKVAGDVGGELKLGEVLLLGGETLQTGAPLVAGGVAPPTPRTNRHCPAHYHEKR